MVCDCMSMVYNSLSLCEIVVANTSTCHSTAAGGGCGNPNNPCSGRFTLIVVCCSVQHLTLRNPASPSTNKGSRAGRMKLSSERCGSLCITAVFFGRGTNIMAGLAMVRAATGQEKGVSLGLALYPRLTPECNTEVAGLRYYGS